MPSHRTPSDHVRSRLLAGIAAATLAALAAGEASATIIHVRASQDLPLALQNGASWATAFQSLQTGLAAASSGDEIRIAGGTYKPTATTDRTATFALKNGVRVRGGYLGQDGSADIRDVWEFVTTLSGEIGDQATIADNSFHVLTASGVGTSAILEGVEITGGNANGLGVNGMGGGLFVTGASPSIIRCLFVENNATKGAGIGRSSGLTTSSALVVSDSVFDGNVAVQGAAIFAQTSPLFLFNSTVRDNVSAAAVDLASIASTSTFSSVILSRNTGGATTEESQFRINAAPLNVTRSCIEGWNNVAPSSPTTIGADPLFLFQPGALTTNRNRYRLRGDSPCIDQGECGIADLGDLDDDGNTSEILSLDFDDETRLVDDLLSPNGGAPTGGLADMGACELHRPRTVLVNHAATGANNGTNWTNAYVSLQSALNELASLADGETAEVWVAQGTYKPTTGSDPLASFVLHHGTAVLGGFAGGERARSLRDWRAHPTVLSGELGPPGPTGNSHHVVRLGESILMLDGFIVRDGAATAGEGGGGVLYEGGSSVRLHHSVITANTGDGPGSGLAALAPGGGGLVVGYTAVVGNSATGSGSAGVFFGGTSSNRLERCVIAGNTSAGAGVASGLQVSGPADGPPVFLRGSIVADNLSGGSNAFTAQVAAVGTPVFIDHCAIQNFNAVPPGFTVLATFATDASGGMIDGDGADDLYGTTDDDYAPPPCSDLIDNGISSITVSELFVDLNDDGVTNFDFLDFDGNTFVVDLPMPQPPSSSAVDIGPIEIQTASAGSPDQNGDGHVDATDLALLLGAWNATTSSADLTGDCFVDAADLAVLLGAWE